MDKARRPQPGERDGQGRFLPGQSGNPAGKPPGTRHRTTVWRELIDDAVVAQAVEALIARALAGNVAAARFLLDRRLPKPRGRAIDLALPAGGDTPGNARAAFDSAVRAALAGTITLDEAAQVGVLLRDRAHVGFGSAAPAPASAPAPALAPTPRPPVDAAAPAAPDAAPGGPEFHQHSQAEAGAPPPPAPPAEPSGFRRRRQAR